MNDEQDDYNEDAELVIGCLYQLTSPEPDDDRFRILDAIAYHTSNLFTHDVWRELRSGKLSEELSRNLLESPVAPVLLAYIVSSLVAYNDSNGVFTEDLMAPTSLKRQVLAEAFSLVGKQGESFPPIGERIALGLKFQRYLTWELDAEAKKFDVVPDKAAKSARDRAFKRTFKGEYGEDYLSFDDTHKSRMRKLRWQLAHITSGFRSSEGG